MMKRIWPAARLPLVLAVCAGLFFGGVRLIEKADRKAGAVSDIGWILIDPGHGGLDAGADAGGVHEKDINLAVSLRLRDILELLGCAVRMTRESDCSIHDENAQTVRQKKVSDLQNRLEMANDADIVVSVHQNYFSQSQYYGAQMFYAPRNPASVRLGERMRESVLAAFQPDNKRQLKKASQDIFLMANTTAPAVLAECGFMSNPEELALLKNPGYQQKMALALAVGIVRFRSEGS